MAGFTLRWWHALKLRVRRTATLIVKLSGRFALRSVIDPCHFGKSPLLGTPCLAAQVHSTLFPTPISSSCPPQLSNACSCSLGLEKGLANRRARRAAIPFPTHALPLLFLPFSCPVSGQAILNLLSPPHRAWIHCLFLLFHLVRCGLSIHQTIGSCKRCLRVQSSTPEARLSFVSVRTQQATKLSSFSYSNHFPISD